MADGMVLPEFIFAAVNKSLLFNRVSDMSTDERQTTPLARISLKMDHFALIQPRLDGEPLGKPIDLYAPRVMVSGRVELGTRTLRAGRHDLGIEIAGKSRASTGTELGIDCFELASEGGESTPPKAR
jgi:hypothetical protein